MCLCKAKCLRRCHAIPIVNIILSKEDFLSLEVGIVILRLENYFFVDAG